MREEESDFVRERRPDKPHTFNSTTMSTSKKTAQKSPEERQRIYDAVTTEERLRVVKERMAPEFSNGRKPLSIGVAFSKSTDVYRLVEEASYYLGYPLGAALDETTGRVAFKQTKDDEMIQWRANESLIENINDVLKALLTGIFTSDDPSFLSQVRQAAVTAKGADDSTKKKVNDFFRDLDVYRHATASVREEERLAKAAVALNDLTAEEIQQILAQKQLAGTPSALAAA